MVKNEISYTVLPEVDSVEAIFVRLMFGSCAVTVGCFYRSPTSECDVMQSLQEYMQRHVMGSRLILLGDFNLPDANWQTMQFSSTCSEIMLDIMFSFNLVQIVTQATRIQGSSSNILDLIFLSEHFPSDEAKIEIVDGISDHKLTICTLPVQDRPVHSQPKITFLDFNSADDTAIVDHLDFEFSGFEELSADSVTDMETLWQKFKEIIFHCIDTYVPHKVKKTRKHNPWITRDIIHAKRKVKRLRNL